MMNHLMVVVVGAFVLLLSCVLVPLSVKADWINHGGDLYNRRFSEREVKISPATVSSLKQKWEFFAGRDITATPAIFEGNVYFPSWNGNIYAVSIVDGSLVWKKNLQEMTGLKGTGYVRNVNVTVSRATPTIAGDLLMVGIYGPAVVIAVERATGNLVWSTSLDSHARAVITMSGTVYEGGFYVGTSSLEEGLSIDDCCTFRGSMLRLEIGSGKILWQTFMLPDNHGKLGEYSGAAIWGSSPSIDANRKLLYIATGNLYTAPKNVVECQEKQNKKKVPDSPNPCIEPDNHEDSILALDMSSGEIKWYRELGGYDAWFGACNDPTTPNCPPGPNPDADFGEAPMLLSGIIDANGTRRDIVVAGQKTGFVWALDCDNGDIVWSSVAGPGVNWGAATDGRRVYTNIVNREQANFTLVPSGQVTRAGAWVALDTNTGKVLWSTANPSNTASAGPVTVTNGVLFGGSVEGHGPIYALNAETGTILWSHNTSATVYGGMSVSDGCVYLGNGYRVAVGASVSAWTSGTSLYAFCTI